MALPDIENGRYELRGTLGSGSMASVYRTWDTELEMERAIKVLSPVMARAPKVRERFRNEAKAMARLQNPNVVAVFQTGLAEDQPYIVMELMDQGSAGDLLDKKGPIKAKKAVKIMVAILDGLAAAHHIGIVHRDIKPENVLLASKGNAKLTDFGIARLTDSDSSLTRTGMAMGTFFFMPPEQMENAKEAGKPADIYACGATLFTLLTGIRKGKLYDYGVDHEAFEALPARLAAVIVNACQPEPEDRFESAEEMATALRNVFQLPPKKSQSRIDDSTSVSGRPAPNRFARVIALLAAGAAGAFTAWAAWTLFLGT